MENLFNNTRVRIGFFLLLFIVTLANSCGNSGNRKEVAKLRKEIDSLRVEIANHPTHKQLQAEGLRISKRTLYDWNSVVRTAVRPDDIMNQYDQEIKKIESEK